MINNYVNLVSTSFVLIECSEHTPAGFLKALNSIIYEAGSDDGSLGHWAGIDPDHVHLIFRRINEIVYESPRYHGCGTVTQRVLSTLDQTVRTTADDTGRFIEIVQVIRQAATRIKTREPATHFDSRIQGGVEVIKEFRSWIDARQAI